MGALLIALTLGLAFANGANDVSKGISTLVGSGVTDYRRAVIWGSLWTLLGALLASLLASGLVATFSGRGLLVTPPEGHAFLTAVGLGAIGWLLIATRTGLPVSTTHALVGGLCGAGIAAGGVHGVLWGAVGAKAAIPLATSPLISLALMGAAFPLIRVGFRRFDRYCVCLERQELVVATASGAAAIQEIRTSAVVGRDCPPQVLTRVGVMDSLHWVSSGLTNLFRGLNDAPKVLALGLAAAGVAGLQGTSLYFLVALAMGAGSYLAGARVTGTLANKVTPMTPSDGFAANLVTSVLVASASSLGVPVSTTHVSSSSIIGIGLHHRSVRWRTVIDVLLAWVVTLPVAGVIAYLAFRLL